MNEQQIIDLLRLRFGGRDFSSLSKKWKEVHYRSVAKEILESWRLLENDRAKTSRENHQ